MTEREFDCIRALVSYSRQDNMTKFRMKMLMEKDGWTKEEIQDALGKVMLPTILPGEHRP
jgi:alkylhydroperoxidase/carboxymuconolactone decarboxylase family protein YurZ